MLIARTATGLEGAILIHPDGTVVTGTGTGGGGPTTSVWSAADAATNGFTLTNGGLTYANNSILYKTIRGTVSRSSGKYYVEFLANVTGGNNQHGLANSTFNIGAEVGVTPISGGVGYNGGYVNGGGFVTNYAQDGYANPGDVVSLAVDFIAGNVWIAFNNGWVNGSDPATGTLPILSFVPATAGALFPAMDEEDPGGSWTLQPTAASQHYLPPPGFQAWDGGPVTPVTSVWSASDATANGMTLSNGGLTATVTLGSWHSIRNTASQSTGKVYVEFLCNVTAGSGNTAYGLASSSFNPGSYLGSSNYSAAIVGGANSVSAGFISNYSMSQYPAANDVVALAVDFTAGKIWFALNNVWVNSSNPATGALPIVSFTPATVGALFAGMSLYNVGDTWTLQSTAAAQKYAPPSGFTPWG